MKRQILQKFVTLLFAVALAMPMASNAFGQGRKDDKPPKEKVIIKKEEKKPPPRDDKPKPKEDPKKKHN